MLAYIAIVGPIGLAIVCYSDGAADCTRSDTAASGWHSRWPASAIVSQDGSTCPRHAVVFCSNHESNVDPPVLFEALHPRLHVLYKAELHKFPIMGKVFDFGGFVPIDRGDRDKAMASIARGAESLRAGNSFLIFPGRDTKPHGASAAVQEGRVHHGHPGAGADRSSRRAGGPGRDAEGQRRGSSRARERADWQADSHQGLTMDDRDDADRSRAECGGAAGRRGVGLGKTSTGRLSAG